MTHRPPAGTRTRRTVRLVLVTAVLGLVVAGSPLAAGAQDAPPAAPTLAQVLDGDVAGLSAVAMTTPMDDGDMGVVLEITNDGADPVDVAIPFGALLVTEDEGDQTLAVVPPSSPEVIDVAAAGGTPTIEAGAGTSSHDLPAYCVELGDGYPIDAAPVSPIAPAEVALAETLRAATVADADHSTTQSAVWWLTDEPMAPAPADIAELLAVDAEAFAAAPYRVTPDTGYTPMWMREDVGPRDGSIEAGPPDEQAAAILDERFEGPASPVSDRDGGGSALGPILWVALIGLVVVATVAIATRSGRTAPATLPAFGAQHPGWYPDPWARGGHRYWDGQRWTTQTMGGPRP